jgi:hypothetical protein
MTEEGVTRGMHWLVPTLTLGVMQSQIQGACKKKGMITHTHNATGDSTTKEEEVCCSSK